MHKMLISTMLAGAAFVAVPASAAVFFFNAPGSVQPDETVQVANNQNDSSAIGFTNQTSTGVTVHSLNTENLLTQSSGQARFFTADGSLDTAEIFLTNTLDADFREIEFNLFNAVGSGQSVTLSFYGSFFDALTNTFNEGVRTYTIGNGQNFVSAYATDGDYFTKVVFDATGAGVADLRQLRISGFTPGAVPEPATWAMMLLGFGIVGGAMRRRRKVGVSYQMA